MEFEDSVTVEASKGYLWELISDPETLVSCVPGAKEVERISETEYSGVIERGLGGITLALNGEVKITEMNAPDNLKAEATGEDKKTNSRLDATAQMQMNATDETQTELEYYIDLDFTGRLASLGARIVKRKISSDIQTYFDNIQSEAES
jgi:carbon monoxide dehydrogenase subunit G